MPWLVLTDITAPGPGGSSLELITWIRAAPEVAHLPIICATGNEHPQTLQAFAKVGVTCHPKTSHMTEIAQAVKEALKQCPAGS
jgi:CheY-like chemotaxis protein